MGVAKGVPFLNSLLLPQKSLGYDDNSPDGECLADWASINCLALLYNAKDAASFYSGR